MRNSSSSLVERLGLRVAIGALRPKPLLLFVSTIHLLACSAPPTEPAEDGGNIGGCKLPYIGDPNAEMVVDVVALGPNGKLKPVENGSDVTLMFPPQGGRVVFAGVRAMNVNPCGVRLAGALRDPVSKSVQVDTRIINLQIAPDGYGQSDIGDIFTFANIFACPNNWSSQDLMDVPYELTVSLTDEEGRKTTRILEVTPRCNEPGQVSGCACQCNSEYVLGMVCAGLPDAGIGDASAEIPDASGD
jgi:hypothetical protein